MNADGRGTHHAKRSEMLEIIGTIATVLAVTGVILNNRRLRFCFVLWVISNSLSLLLHLDAALWSLVVRDAIFTVLSIEGWIKWGRSTSHGK